MNIMSYYDLVSSSPSEVSAFSGKSVPKTKLGIGYGYDTDQEVDGPNECGNGANGNPTDVNAKCLYSINNGCGGIMIWEIDRAPAACDSVTALYVNKNAATSVQPSYVMNYSTSGNSLLIRKNRATGMNEISYTVPGTSGSAVDVSMFSANGALVRTLVHGVCNPGVYSFALQPGTMVANSGFYVFKLRTNSGIEASKAFLEK